MLRKGIMYGTEILDEQRHFGIYLRTYSNDGTEKQNAARIAFKQEGGLWNGKFRPAFTYLLTALYE